MASGMEIFRDYSKSATTAGDPQGYFNKNNVYKWSLLNTFFPKSLQKVSLSLLVGSIPLEQPMRQSEVPQQSTAVQ